MLLCCFDRSTTAVSYTHLEMAAKTNPDRLTGTLADAMRGADVFIGVSAPGVVSKEMVASMNDGAVVFAMEMCIRDRGRSPGFGSYACNSTRCSHSVSLRLRT